MSKSDMEYTQPVIVQDLEETLNPIVLEKIKQYLLNDRIDDDWKTVILELAKEGR